MTLRDLLAACALLTVAASASAQRQSARAAETAAGPQQLNCDMLTFAGQLDHATTRELEPAHSLDAAAAILTRHNVAFSRERGTLTFGQMSRKLLDDLNKLPAGEPIILPNEAGGAICVLVPGGDTY